MSELEIVEAGPTKSEHLKKAAEIVAILRTCGPEWVEVFYTVMRIVVEKPTTLEPRRIIQDRGL
jgi:hypothetical protein